MMNDVPSAADAADYFMGWSLDEDILRHSSSGGLFSTLANVIFSMDGLVVGASLDVDSRELRHVVASNASELESLRFSKYYQSNTEDIYVKVRDALRGGRKVLFTGTACQVAALKLFLAKESQTELLFTADVLCHGVTNRHVVDAYLRSKEREEGKAVSSYQFRSKGDGIPWKNGGGTSTKLEFSDGSTYLGRRQTDTFFVGFNQNLFLRESCYSCRFCGRRRVSDITMADYWGVDESEVPEKQLTDGVSAFTINTEKGRRLLSKCCNFEYHPADANNVTSHNRAFSSPQPRPVMRDTIVTDLLSQDFDSVMHKYMRKYYLKTYVKLGLFCIFGEDRVNRWRSRLR